MGDIGLPRDDIIEWLDTLGDLAVEGPNTLLEHSEYGGGVRCSKYKIVAPTETMFMAGLLCNSNHIKDALRIVIRMLFPHDLGFARKVFDQDFHTPSDTVLSHFRLCVDVSYARAVSAFAIL